ncbi:MAG: hypothetical protein AAFP17_10380 [Pseudomonadota bacterium]
MNASSKPTTRCQSIVDVIMRTAKASFGEAQIDRVDLGDDEDGEFLRVVVVVKEAENLSDEALASFIRIVRSALEDEGDDRFPLISYVNDSEMQRATAEA